MYYSRAGGSFSVTRSSVEFSIGCGGLNDDDLDRTIRTKRATTANTNININNTVDGQASTSASAGTSAGVNASVGVSVSGHTSTNNTSTPALATTTTTTTTTNNGTANNGIRAKLPVPRVGSSLAGALPDHSPNNYDITKIRVCIVAENSDVANSSIPG